MRSLRRILVGGFALVAVLALVLVGLGLSQPKDHEVSREVVLAAEPAKVWSAVTRFKEYPGWRTTVTSVDLVSDTRPAPYVGQQFREVGPQDVILFEVEEVRGTPGVGQRLVTRIADDTLGFGGRWIFEISPVAGVGADAGMAARTKVRITEQGTVDSLMYRAFSLFFSKTATMEGFIKDLREHVE